MTVSSSGTTSTGLKPAAPSFGRLLLDRVAATPNAEAFRYPSGPGWAELSWGETGERVARLAAGLLALGLATEERVAIACSTRIEWILADFAVMCAGGAVTTVYPTTLGDDVAFIVADSGSRFVVAEDETQVAKLRERRDQIKDVEKVIVVDGPLSEADGDWVLTLGALEDLGRQYLAEKPSAVEDAVAASSPDHLATLIYTSGTTGRPKGVQLTHANWCYEGAAVDSVDILRLDDVQYLWLPLAHSFGKVLLAVQCQVGFSSAVDGRVDKIVENLGTIRPTFMAGVPRIFEKVYGRVVQLAEEEGGVKLRIFQWAFSVGGKVAAARAEGREPGALLKAQYTVADRLVFTKIKERMGGRIRLFASGSAALSPDVARWFDAAGLMLLEGYGLTETSAATTINLPGKVGFGTVGQPFPGTEIRIADDGEIMVRGGGVMRGYHNLPEQTAEVLPGDGWFATGDVGELDARGRVRITDRKKDLLKTSGGKYIAPQHIESEFKAICPIASQMIVTARNFAAALITLDVDGLAQWGRAKGLEGDFAALTKDAQTLAYVQHCLDELNGRLNRWESIKQFRILDRDLSIEEGELTPSLKVKRAVVEAKFSVLIESMYAARS
ncbi:MAG: AMP-dependent synthetase/ligase [Actinomycetes bacterium]